MSNYTVEDLQKQIKPLSENGFVRFFQNIWRWWLSVWYGFSEKHPKLSKWIYQIFFFVVFSEGVTIFQILVLIFLPSWFGLELAATEFMIPKVPITIGDFTYYWSFLGNDLNYDANGNVIIGGGLGYFLAFKIATFLAQCINFPLQRNITYRSHGNPWYQAMWYFIGWVLINLACDAVNNLWLPIANHYLPYAVSSILAMIAQGGIAMVIFFFIFMVIFPDNAKMAKNAKAKLEKLEADGAPAEEIAAAKAKYEELQLKADLTASEKGEIAAKSLASANALRYFAAVKNAEKAEEAEKAEYEKKAEECFEKACESIVAKEKAIEERKVVLARAEEAKKAAATA